MKSKNTHISSSLRFRRWSRAGYAVFCSLGCTVTIGSLAVSVSDKSLQKSVGNSKCPAFNFTCDVDSRDPFSELQDPEILLCPGKEMSFLKNSTESAAACSRNTNNYFINLNG